MHIKAGNLLAIVAVERPNLTVADHMCAHMFCMHSYMHALSRTMFVLNYRMAGNFGGEFILADWRF